MTTEFQIPGLTHFYLAPLLEVTDGKWLVQDNLGLTFYATTSQKCMGNQIKKNSN